MGKSSQKTNSVSNTVYGSTTTSNPYATAKTNNSGTKASFKKGTALDTIYNFVNKNTANLLDEYLNPTLDSNVNQAKINAFTKNLNQQALSALENNIINPLSKRNMIRSSQASDLYKNLSNQTTSSIDDYINELLATSQDETANMLTNLFNYYMQGYNVLSNMQNQSLQTSSGNARRSGTSVVASNPSLLQNAAQIAELATKLKPLIK